MRLAFAVCTLALAGCASTPVSIKETKSAPKARLLAFQGPADRESGALVFIRDSSLIGAGCFVALHINGQLAARIDMGERARFRVPPGEVLLRVGRDPAGQALCSFGQDNWTARETVLRPGETKWFRLTIDENGKFDVIRAEVF